MFHVYWRKNRMKKILYILIVIVLFSSCTKQFSETAENTTIPETSVLSKVDKSEYFEAIKKFNWASYDEKPFLYENIFAHECKVFVCDIDEDEIPEIMLTEIYSPREADATEILKFENGEYVSAYSFWGNCYSDEENISFYENQNKDKVMISKTSSYHGGVRNTVVSEINISTFSYKVLYGKTEYDNGSEKYFVINEEKEITRDFIDGGFSGYTETEKENFETFLNE